MTETADPDDIQKDDMVNFVDMHSDPPCLKDEL